ncbi:MAG: sulfocyanin-like copper-binding protein [Dehalococcoidia bacterium]|nr:sulfocyanin-like copper-binding protein [Dehalococcoidia bacterium]
MKTMKYASRTAVALGLLLVVGLAGACSSDEEDEEESTATATMAVGTTVQVDLTEYVVKPSVLSAPHGPVTFVAKNSGTIEHELVVVRSDADVGALTMVADGSKVDEDAIDAVGEIPELEVGAEDSETFELAAGRYLLICNVEGHYTSGMVVAFTVE